MTNNELLLKALQFIEDIDRGEEFYLNYILPLDKRSIQEIIIEEYNESK